MSSTNPNPNEKVQLASVFGQVTEKLFKESKGKTAEKHAENPTAAEESKSETEIEMDSQVCRICLEGESESPLISPCSCSGSCALVHLKCLRLWLMTSTLTLTRKNSTEVCEICHGAYKLKIFRADPPFREYALKNPMVTVDMATFILFTILILVSTALTVVHVYDLIFVHKDEMVGVGISFLFVLLIGAYNVWICTTLKAYVLRWNEWRIQHQRVLLFPNTNNNTEAISISMETETDENPSNDLFARTQLNTIIQINEADSAAYLNNDANCES